MSLRRWRLGEWVALVGLAAIVAGYCFAWYAIDWGAPAATVPAEAAIPADGSIAYLPESQIDYLFAGTLGPTIVGHPWVELPGLFGVGIVAVLVMTLRSGPGRPTYGVTVGTVLALGLGALVLVLTASRTLLWGPEVGGPAAGTVRFDASTGTWLALGGIVVGLVGLWIALADDRTRARENAVLPPAARDIRPLPDA